MKQLTKKELSARRALQSESALQNRLPIYVVLESLKSGHNVGTILRTCDAIRVKKVFICGDTVLPTSYKVRLGSQGSHKWVDWEYQPSASAVLEELKREGVQIIAAEFADESILYTEVSFVAPTCLVFGREFDGVSEQSLALCNFVVHLPLLGMVNSINVSVAAGVLLYEAARQITKGTFLIP